MPALELRPLVVLREHDGFASAYCAGRLDAVSYGEDPEEALEELTLYLSEFLADTDAETIQGLAIVEPAEARFVSVVVPRAHLARVGRMRTAVDISCIELMAGRARWVLLPAFGHVIYVGTRDVAALDEIVRKEVLRLAAAVDLDGAEYLDLLPPDSFDLCRPSVNVAPRAREAGADARRKAAEKLLQSIGRKLGPPKAPVLFRDTAQLAALLESPTRSSVVLVGQPGSGKSALMRQALVELERPPLVVATSGAELVAGQSFLGQLEQRIEQVMQAAELLDAVLYFEELDDLFAGRPGGYEDMASAMQRYVEQGRVRLMGELSAADYDRLQHRHVGFFAYLTEIPVPALSSDETRAVLRSRAELELRRGQPALAEEATQHVVELVERYDPYAALPGKAVKLLDELCALRQAEPRDDGSLELTADDVFRGMSVRTGVPEFLLRDERSLPVEQIERFFAERLVGQRPAIASVAETLCTLKAGLQPRTKPLATFLFVGPTGVGKTELAKALSRYLFGTTERLVRFDMSEYGDPYAAERLIRGTDMESGVLTRRIREQPFSVILLDEIEKADPAVFDLLLQVLGEGRLSDARGRTTWFDNSIIIMTSNLGAAHRRPGVGFGDTGSTEHAYYLGVVREHFRPEFVNRLDRVVFFENLDREQIHAVARLSLARIAQRDGLAQRGILLEVSDAALEQLAEDGFSASYGARGLRRHLEQCLIAPVAEVVAAQGAGAAGQLVRVSTEGEPGNDARELGRAVRGRLVFRVIGQAGERMFRDVSGVIEISRLRRRLNRWRLLGPIRELGERAGEIQVQLSRASGTKRQRRRAPRGLQLGELSAEHARILALLEPLDAREQELEQIESLMVTAIWEDAEPKFFMAEAERAYRDFRRSLVPALLHQSDENAIALALHQLDDRRVLHRLLLPLIDYVVERGWRLLIHVDRGQRGAEDAWPALAVRRFGPPMSSQQYLERHDEDAPTSTVLLRVQGVGCGALLAFGAGRWRFPTDGLPGDLLWRIATPRFEIDDDLWKHESLQPTLDLAVARGAPMRVELTADAGAIIAGRAEPQLTESQLFARYDDLALDYLISVIASGQRFLPGSG